MDSNVSMKEIIRKTNSGGHIHWCDGCEELHLVPHDWMFNGSYLEPEFNPSVKHTWNYTEDGRPDRVCHYFIRKGQIEYCGDCFHSLAGQTLQLRDLEDALAKY